MTDGGALVLGVAELMRRPGTRRAVRRTVVLDDLQLEELAVVAGPEVAVDLVAESLPDAIVVLGSITGAWKGTCRRCLEPVEGALDVAVHELYAAEVDDDDDEVQLLPQEELDLGEVVRASVLLALPLAPLCADGCRGPDPERFSTEPVADDEPAAIDPRWAALDGLTFGGDS